MGGICRIEKIETEAKIRVDEGEFMRVYESLGRPEFVREQNWGVFIPQGFVRVRSIGENRYITVKQKSEGPYNSREEIEFEVSDVGLARKMFNRLGLYDEYYYEKKRAKVTHLGCEVCFDDVLDLGKFVEVEGDGEGISTCLKEFGLDEGRIERRSYIEMVRGEQPSIDSYFG